MYFVDRMLTKVDGILYFVGRMLTKICEMLHYVDRMLYKIIKCWQNVASVGIMLVSVGGT